MGMFSKDTDYFALFEEGISFSLQAAKELQSAFPNGAVNVDTLHYIKDIEHAADKHVHKCLNLIEEAFITPIDRTDILEIVKGIEDITDSVDEIANTIYILNIKEIDHDLKKFINLLVKACEALTEMMTGLKQFKKNFKRLDELNTKVNHIEEEGDAIYMEEMHKLFSPDNKVEILDIIRRKELLYRLENSLDRCEDVADAIEKILIAKT